MTIDAGLRTLVSAAVVPSVPLVRAGRVVAFDGSIVEAVGIAGAPGQLAAIGPDRRPAELVGFRGEHAVLMGLAPLEGIAPGAAVRPQATAGMVACGGALLGRTIDGLGRPLDGLGPLPTGPMRPARPGSADIADRARVTAPLATGVRPIDALLTFGIGQRIGIMAGTGVGKSVLLGQIARWAQADIVVMALIGERSREIADFVATELAGPALARTVTVAVPASEPMLLRIRAAERAFAIAEQARAEGRHALLILDSLSRVVHGAREVALARGEPAGSRAYPPSALQMVASLAERAGGDRRTGGAITLIATVLAESDDRADPVVDAARGVMDGHVLLSRRLAARGQFPAIDLGSSASRVMADVTDADHQRAAARFRRLVALGEENRDLVLMGAYAPGSDPTLDEALALAPRLEAFCTQDRHMRVDWQDSMAQLMELVA